MIIHLLREKDEILDLCHFSYFKNDLAYFRPDTYVRKSAFLRSRNSYILPPPLDQIMKLIFKFLITIKLEFIPVFIFLSFNIIGSHLKKVEKLIEAFR